MAKYQNRGDEFSGGIDLTDDAAGGNFSNDINDSSFNTNQFEPIQINTSSTFDKISTARIINVNHPFQNIKFCKNSIR